MSDVTFLRGMLTHERGLFNKVASAVLEDGMDYRPDPKARSSRELIEHIIGHQLDMVELVEDGVIHHRNQVPFESLQDGIRQLDDSFEKAIAALGSVDDEQWQQPATFMVGEQVIMEGPRQQMAWILFLDAIHHRGQLSTHLRPMGSKVPAMYGPSADDQGEPH